MPNDTQAARQRRAEAEHREKKRLERAFAVQIRQILRNMSEDLAAVYGATGTVIDAGQYRDDFIGVLRPQYRKVERAFVGQTEEIIEEGVEEEDPERMPFELLLLLSLSARNGTTLDQEIEHFRNKRSAAIIDFNDRTVPSRADLITRTNQSELDRAVARATAEAVESGAAITRAEVGAAAGKIFRDSSLYRGNLIAATETQTAAEAAKQIEAETFNSQVQPLADSGEAQIERIKEWHTMGDERVREAHIQADLQAVGFEEPFIVGGESLLYPGDISLGASPGNTINCRCSAIYFVDGAISRVVTAESDTGEL